MNMPVIGREIAGRYRLRGILGSGGSGTVYLAYDMILNKEWAVKAVPRSRRQAEDEIETLKTLSHPRLPRIVDAVREAGAVWIVMDLGEGGTLAEKIRRCGGQPEAAVIRWGIQLCGVLIYLASRKPPLIYRDMKPSNILLRPDGEVMLIDLGSAGGQAVLDAEQSGTPVFAAPEQTGIHGRVDPRSDIYSLGMTMIALLTGTEEPADITWKKLAFLEPPVSEPLIRVLRTATRERPSLRYQTAEDFRDALNGCRESERAGLAVRRKRALGSVGMALAGTLLLLAGSACRETLLTEMGAQYAGLLSEAAGLENSSARRAARCYEEAMTLLPSRSEAYLQYLEAMNRQGRTREGILNVAARMASGGKPDDEVAYRIGRLCFEGTESMERDYRGAERWFGRVDETRYPETVYCRAVCRMLEGGGTTDWKKLDQMLTAFAADSASYEDTKRRTEARLMIAGIYRGHQQGFAEAGISGCGRAAEVLEKAENEYTDEHSPEAAVMLRDVLSNLAAIYCIEEGPYSCFHPERAAAIYATLAEEADTKEERKEYAFREAAASQLTNDSERTVTLYRGLVRRYPEARTYFRFSLWLLDCGKKEEAEGYFRAGQRMKKAEECPEYEILRKRLSGGAAGAESGAETKTGVKSGKENGSEGVLPEAAETDSAAVTAQSEAAGTGPDLAVPGGGAEAKHPDRRTAGGDS